LSVEKRNTLLVLDKQNQKEVKKATHVLDFNAKENGIPVTLSSAGSTVKSSIMIRTIGFVR
jgi:RNase P/RNase MRP subunit p29